MLSTNNPTHRKTLPILDSHIAYIDEGTGNPILFLHGNPTSSYLWRNIMPHCTDVGRILAPDLIGMGHSGNNPANTYRFADHYRYLSAWIDAMNLGDNIILVIHDWGSGLGFHWAHKHPDRVAGIVYMEAIVRPVTFADWPDSARGIFQAMRSPKGENLVLERNFFVERILPASIKRTLTDEEMTVYRARYADSTASRLPTLQWPCEIPFDGEPADNHALIQAYADWLSTSDTLPKLFINADPGIILIGNQRDFCRTWPNQTEITVSGLHFIQEDSPNEIGAATADFAKRVFSNS